MTTFCHLYHFHYRTFRFYFQYFLTNFAFSVLQSNVVTLVIAPVKGLRDYDYVYVTIYNQGIASGLWPGQ